MSFAGAYDGGIVVNSGGYSGGSNWSDYPSYVKEYAMSNPYTFSIIVVSIVIIIMILSGLVGWGIAESYTSSDDHPNGIRFKALNSDNFSQSDRPSDYNMNSSGFVNSREAPYFPDVTNRVLRMENREKEAVRALGKINSERQRRAVEDSSDNNTLEWGPFWKEWKATHPMDGEEASGFSNDFEEKLGGMSPY
jgi:hypothetical protein